MVNQKNLIVVLDSSGSMSGSKWDAAVKGVEAVWESNYDNKELRIVSQYSSVRSSRKLAEIPKYAGGGTPLYDVLGEVLQELLNKKELSPTVVSIFTDGDDTEGFRGGWTRQRMSEAFATLSDKGVAFTFVGTKQDVEKIQEFFGLSKENTLSYDNTGEGLGKAMDTYKVSLDTYSKDIDSGQADTRGFFKEMS